MPAKDHIHESVKRALIKEGWDILRDQYPIRIGTKRVWVDLSAEKQDLSQAAFIEIKEFRDEGFVEALRDAVGQYVLYRAALKYIKMGDIPLFLAVPQTAISGIFETAIGELVIREVELNLVAFDPDLEVITQWLPYKTPSDR
jgi:hypothetical protein